MLARSKAPPTLGEDLRRNNELNQERWAARRRMSRDDFLLLVAVSLVSLVCVGTVLLGFERDDRELIVIGAIAWIALSITSVVVGAVRHVRAEGRRRR